MIIPTLWMILLIAWPFLDRAARAPHLEAADRHGHRRLVPIVLLALTWYGSKAPAVGEASTHPGAFAVHANGCNTCHTMADAGIGAPGPGPNLDSAKPTFDLAHDRITNGGGGMPAFGAT